MISNQVVEINGYEYWARVDYTYHKGSPGARERGTGAPLEPDEPASVEINYVEIDFNSGTSYDKPKAWQRIELPPEILEDFEKEILEDDQ